MTVEVRIQKSPVMEDRLILRVKPGGKRTTDDFVEWLVYASTLTETDIRGVLAGMRNYLLEQLSNGATVDLEDLGIWSISIPGSYAEADEKKIRPANARTAVRVNMRPKPFYHRIVTKNARFHTQRQSTRRPVIENVSLPISKAANTFLPGENLMIRGAHLKFDPADMEQGVFLLESKKKIHRIDHYAIQTRGRIVFVVPRELKNTRELRLEVRIRYRRTKTSPPGDLRVSQYNPLLIEKVEE